MTSDGLFTLLSFAPCGVYAVTVDQTVVFWNRTAERILGYSSHEVVGRKCYEVVASGECRGLTDQCADGCPSLRYMKAGLVPAPGKVAMHASGGAVKWVALNPMVVAGVVESAPLLVHFFDEVADGVDTDSGVMDVTPEMLNGNLEARTGARRNGRTSPGDGQSALSARELQVLRLMADGMDNTQISSELEISLFTVRNHIRNVRQKLDAGTKLEAVVNAVKLGLLRLS